MLPFGLGCQAEIARMIEIMEEQDRRNEESLATIAQRDAAIDQLSQQVRRRWDPHRSWCDRHAVEKSATPAGHSMTARPSTVSASRMSEMTRSA